MKEDISLKEKIKQIEKKYGCKVNLGCEQFEKQKYFSSGSFIIDQLTGINGYPMQKIIEIFGQPSTGKTTLALHAIKEFQELTKKRAVFFDIERTLNLDYAQVIGVKVKDLVVLKPKNAEETFDLIGDFLKTEEFNLIVIDSVAALLPETEEKSQMTENTIGLQARIMSKALRKINYLLNKTDSTIIFINQMREKIKLFFGNPETTTGGNALKFYASLRIELRKKSKLTINKESGGISVAVKIVKNKLAKPFQTGIVPIVFGKGIFKIREVTELAIEKKIITKKGSWCWYEKNKLGMGLEKSIDFLKKNTEMFNEIKNKLMSTKIFEN